MASPVGIAPRLEHSERASVTPDAIRRIVLEQSYRARVGHVGSALCIADIMAALFGQVLRIDDPANESRDRFILSKGHAALALYAAIHLRGWLTAEHLNTYMADGTLLGVHPERMLRGVDFSSGSLGQGLPIGVGSALAARMRGSDRRVFVLVSDAECNEGALWEAVMFAAHHKLANLVAIVDANGQQALGYTREVLSLAPLEARWSTFGWDARVVDGHDIGALTSAMLEPHDALSPRPRVLIANTIFGRGVSYMERQISWHYLAMSDADYARALAEIQAGA